MRFLVIFVLLLVSVPLAFARPSFRSLREDAEQNQFQIGEAGWRMQFYSDDTAGLRVAYPASWISLEEGTSKSTDGTVSYDFVRLQPPDFGFGERANYILEMEVLVWDVGYPLDPKDLDVFARAESAARYREFWIQKATETTVADIPTWRYEITAMSGLREEVWFSAGRYVYTLGYRSLRDFYGDNHFFFDDLVASTQVTIIQPSTITTSTPSPNPNPNPIFSDVEVSHPYVSAIEWGKELGVVGGYPDGTFQPDRTVNRAEFLKIALGAAGVDVGDLSGSSFSDVNPDAWFAPYVAYALQMGIVQGYSDPSNSSGQALFKPEQTVNVAEALKMAYGALYVDTEEVDGEWYLRFLGHARANQVLFSDGLDVGGEMSRKDTIWIMWKLNML